MSGSRIFRVALVTFAAPLALAITASVAVQAQGLGLKPGLWEVKVIKQLMDGRDMAAQMAAAEQAMANLPPEQRARMEAMISKAGVGMDPTNRGGFRICISPEMAQRNALILDKDGHCKPVQLSRHGDQINYQFSCTSNATTMQGKGVATVSPELVSTHTDMTTTAAGGGTHQIESESQMSYIGGDCGDLKPPTN